MGYRSDRLMAKVFLHERECHIDASGDTRGRIDASILDENLILLHRELGKTLRKLWGVMPVSGHAFTIEQPRGG